MTVPAFWRPNESAAVAYGQPHPLLAGHVVAYTGQDVTHERPVVRRVTALGTVTVAIDFQSPTRRLLTDRQPAPQGPVVSPVSGLSQRPFMLAQSGREYGLTMQLTPLGGFAMFGFPLRELANRSVSFGDLLGRRAERLVERLADAPGWAARFRLLDEQLLRWIAEGPALAGPVAHAWRRIAGRAGRLSITELAGEVGWTRPHLNARFHQQIGLPPKVVARLARTRAAVSLRGTRPRLTWSGVAAMTGFADQAHLIREFRALTGCTPTELIALDSGAGEVFMGGAVDLALRGRRTPTPE
jgi:AraC-like DNA-binding protein